MYLCLNGIIVNTMKTEIFSLASGVDGLPLSVAMTRPEGTPKGIIQIVHGLIEHKERYFQLMEWLSEHGYACIISDLRGHGASIRTEDDLGYFGENGWLAFVEDTKVTGDKAREEFGDIPFTLIGHSMGSLVVRSYLKRYDSTIDRLIVSGSPSDNPAKGAGKVLAKAIGIARGTHYRSKLLPSISFAGYNDAFKDDNYDRAWVCSDPEILKAYHSDPLCSFDFTADGYTNLFELMTDCYGTSGWHVSKPDLPIRFISGALDPCRGSDKAWRESIAFLQARGYKNVSGKLYPGMRHEVLNETDKLTVWNDILEMLLKTNNQ